MQKLTSNPYFLSRVQNDMGGFPEYISKFRWIDNDIC